MATIGTHSALQAKLEIPELESLIADRKSQVSRFSGKLFGFFKPFGHYTFDWKRDFELIRDMKERKTKQTTVTKSEEVREAVNARWGQAKEEIATWHESNEVVKCGIREIHYVIIKNGKVVCETMASAIVRVVETNERGINKSIEDKAATFLQLPFTPEITEKLLKENGMNVEHGAFIERWMATINDGRCSLRINPDVALYRGEEQLGGKIPSVRDIVLNQLI